MYPYEDMDSFKMFSNKQLPDISKFLSSLKDESISKKDYVHDIVIWNMLKEKTIGDYHDPYLKIDVLILVDVFEKFINTCVEYYG